MLLVWCSPVSTLSRLHATRQLPLTPDHRLFRQPLVLHPHKGHASQEQDRPFACRCLEALALHDVLRAFSWEPISCIRTRPFALDALGLSAMNMRPRDARTPRTGFSSNLASSVRTISSSYPSPNPNPTNRVAPTARYILRQSLPISRKPKQINGGVELVFYCRRITVGSTPINRALLCL